MIYALGMVLGAIVGAAAGGGWGSMFGIAIGGAASALAAVGYSALNDSMAASNRRKFAIRLEHVHGPDLRRIYPGLSQLEQIAKIEQLTKEVVVESHNQTVAMFGRNLPPHQHALRALETAQTIIEAMESPADQEASELIVVAMANGMANPR